MLLGELVGLLFPEKPVEGDLPAHDGEYEREEAFSEVVDPGRVDNEAGGDGDGAHDDKEREREYDPPERPFEYLPAGRRRAAVGIRYLPNPCVPAHGLVP